MQKNQPSMQKVARLSLLCFLTLLTVTAFAQRPRISRVIHNGTRTLTTGESIDVILIGDPGGRARFEILGAIRSVDMREVSRGRYEAHYRIPAGLEVERGIVIGYLTRDGYESVLEADKEITIRMGGSGTGTPARANTITTTPENNSSTNNVRPKVVVRFPEAVDSASMKFYLDGIDFTRRVRYGDGTRRLQWNPHYDLTRGTHKAEVSGRDRYGDRVSHAWSFTVGQGSGQSQGQGAIQSFLPERDSTVSSRRPSIGVAFLEDVTSQRLIVDGRDFTPQAQRSAGKIVWTPNYDLSVGQHSAQVSAVNRNGQSISHRWDFTIGQASDGLTSITFTPAKIRAGETVTVTASASPNGSLTYDLGTRRRGMLLKETNSPGQYTAKYTALKGDEGQHQLFAKMRLPNGTVLTKGSSTYLVIEQASSFLVDNIREGMGVPTNFNVQGSAPAGTQVTVTTEYAKRDFLGALSGQTKRTTFTATATAGKRFDVPVHIGLKKGTKFKLTVSSNAGQPLVYNLIRQ